MRWFVSQLIIIIAFISPNLVSRLMKGQGGHIIGSITTPSMLLSQRKPFVPFKVGLRGRVAGERLWNRILHEIEIWDPLTLRALTDVLEDARCSNSLLRFFLEQELRGYYANIHRLPVKNLHQFTLEIIFMIPRHEKSLSSENPRKPSPNHLIHGPSSWWFS